MAMIKAFNQLALMVPMEILAEKTPKARAKVIEAFIKVRKWDIIVPIVVTQLLYNIYMYVYIFNSTLTHATIINIIHESECDKAKYTS